MHFTSLTCFKMSETCLGENSSISKRRKARRGKRWRNEEKKRKFMNEYMKQRKHRVAPSNTTQFLMEDREKIEPILNLSPTSTISSSDENEEIEFEVDVELDKFNEQFFLKDFERTYRQLYRDNLNSLTKLELLQKVKDLQDHRDNLENEKQFCFNSSTNSEFAENRMKEPIGEHSNSLRREFQQLQEQNDSLRDENNVLKQQGKDVRY